MRISLLILLKNPLFVALGLALAGTVLLPCISLFILSSNTLFVALGIAVDAKWLLPCTSFLSFLFRWLAVVVGVRCLARLRLVRWGVPLLVLELIPLLLTIRGRKEMRWIFFFWIFGAAHLRQICKVERAVQWAQTRL